MNLLAKANIPYKFVTSEGNVDGTATKFVAPQKAPLRDDKPSVPHCDTLDIRGAPLYPFVASNPNELAAPPTVI